MYEWVNLTNRGESCFFLIVSCFPKHPLPRLRPKWIYSFPLCLYVMSCGFKWDLLPVCFTGDIHNKGICVCKWITASALKKINSTVKDGLVGLPAEINCSQNPAFRSQISKALKGCMQEHLFWLILPTNSSLGNGNLPLLTVNRCAYAQIQMQKHAPTHTG